MRRMRPSLGTDPVANRESVAREFEVWFRFARTTSLGDANPAQSRNRCIGIIIAITRHALLTTRCLPQHEPPGGFAMSSAERADGGALRAYRGSLNQFRPLERDVERELASRYRDGDRGAGQKIIEACLPFVVSIALEYRRWGVPLEDIIQQGNLGLLKAALKFDLTRECRLATYAAYWIRAEIREYVVRGFRVIRLGTTKGERRALRAYRKTGVTCPLELAKLSGLSEERVRLLLPILAAKESSLDATSGEMGPAIERLAANTASPEEAASRHELGSLARTAVQDAVSGLDAREQLIVRARLMTEDPPTLQELGAQLGVSKERVRQLEHRACVKLRGGLRHIAELVA
jgi:RNA polymerase sigma-32 factor